MSEHTPGPWAADMAGCDTSHGLPIIVKNNGHLLAMLADRNEANARLIAAAPEMLEALRALVAAVEVHGWQGRLDDDPKARAIAAIAKAEGR